MGLEGRFLSDFWAGLARLCRISPGTGNGLWSGVGQGEKNIICREDRASRHMKYRHVQGATNSPLWLGCVVSGRGPCKLWKGVGLSLQWLRSQRKF